MGFWTDKEVMITGGFGLIGRPMFRKLLDLGASLHVFDLPYDVKNYEMVLQRLQSTEADICIHLAAVSHVEDSREKPLEAFETNVAGTWNVLQACLETEVKSVVIAASNHVYGEQEKYPVPESAQMNQLDTYSVTKICADYLARCYAHNYGLPVASIRNTNCYGPEDLHISHIVPGTIRAVLGGEVPVINGDGRTSKSYLYVDDVVDAYLMVSEALYVGAVDPGEVFNVSCPPISVADLVEKILQLMDASPNYLIKGQPNDQSNERLDSTKIEQLGWSPRYSLDEGLAKTIEGFMATAEVTA